MASAANLRSRIECTLANRVPSALTLKIKQSPELFATKIDAIDTLLCGGIPRGGITEITGPASSGKTSFSLAAVASVTQSGAACAWVDGSDSFSPESAAAAGAHLKRLLWLRMTVERRVRIVKPWPQLEQALKSTDLLLQAGGFAAIVLDLSEIQPQHIMRIPLATWHRFRLAAEQARTALLLLTQAPCAGSCTALTLKCESSDVVPFAHAGETALFERQQYMLVRERSRNEGSVIPFKKPPTRVEWSAENLWARVR